jgi:hypothetical protein
LLRVECFHELFSFAPIEAQERFTAFSTAVAISISMQYFLYRQLVITGFTYRQVELDRCTILYYSISMSKYSNVKKSHIVIILLYVLYSISSNYELFLFERQKGVFRIFSRGGIWKISFFICLKDSF